MKDTGEMLYRKDLAQSRNLEDQTGAFLEVNEKIGEMESEEDFKCRLEG